MANKREGDFILNNYDKGTGLPFNSRIVSEFPDGTPITDADVSGDNKVILKNAARNGGGYSVRSFDAGQSKTLVVDNVEAIRNLSKSNVNMFRFGIYTNIRTEGYYEPNDGGGFEYLYNPLSADVDDGFLFIKPSLLATGRFIPNIKDGTINVKIAGAKNGLENSIEAFRKALNYGHNAYVLAEGEFSFTEGETISVTGLDGVTLDIKGTINSHIYRAFQFTDCNRFELINMVADGMQQASVIASFNDCLSVKVNNITCKNIGNATINQCRGIEFNGDCSGSSVHLSDFEDITSSAVAFGIAFNHANGLWSKYINIDKCNFTNIQPRGDSDGIKVLHSGEPTYLNITNCNFVDCFKRGIKLQGKYVNISNCSFSGIFSHSCIDAQQGYTHMSNISISTSECDNMIYFAGEDCSIKTATLINTNPSATNGTVRGINMSKLGGVLSDANGFGFLIQDVLIKGVNQPLYITNYQNSFLKIVNLSIDGFQSSYALNYTGNVQLNILELSKISVNDTPSPYYAFMLHTINANDCLVIDNYTGIFNTPATVLSDLNVNKLETTLTNARIKRLVQTGTRKTFYSISAPSATDVNILKYAKQGDEVVNLNGLSSVEKWVCTVSGDVINNTIGTWIPLNRLSQSTAVSDITAPTVTTIEEANTAIQELVTTINNMLTTDRASGQRQS